MSSPKADLKAEMNGRTRTVSGTESVTSATSGRSGGPQSPRPRVDSAGSGTPRPVKPAGVARLQRQISQGGGSPITRSDSVSSRHRRPSLSLGHANAIPFHIEKPPPEEVDPSQDDGDYFVDDVVYNKNGFRVSKTRQVPWWTSKRLQLSFICFIGFFFLYSLRVNLSTAIVCMTRDMKEIRVYKNSTIVYSAGSATSPPSSNNGTVVVTDATAAALNYTTKLVCEEEDTEHRGGDFCWDKKLRGLVLGAFFWGYTIMQIPSGYLSDRFGPRLSVSIGMFPVALLTIICPFMARGSPYLLLAGRIVIGFGEAMMYPGMQSLWAKWSPPHERSRLVGFAFGGSQLGNALTFPFAGLLCKYGFDGGWPSVFYVTGGLAFLWCLLYVFVARDSPAQMSSIKPIESKYIEQSLGVYGQTVEERLQDRKKDKPWLKIFTSGPVWAILLANACGNFGAYMLLTQMPTYMKEVLKFDITSNGAFSMIPYLVFWVFIIVGGQIADVIISKNILSIEWTRKLCCALGTVLPGVFLILTGYMDENHQVAAVVLLSLSMGFCGFQFSSFFINHGDIAPKYAGTVFGFTNTGASVPGILAPYVVAAMTPNKTREEWLGAFYLAGAVYVAGAVIYAILAKGEVQSWAEEDVDHDHVPAEQYPLHGISEEHEHDHEHDEDEKAAEQNALVNENENEKKNS